MDFCESLGDMRLKNLFVEGAAAIRNALIHRNVFVYSAQGTSSAAAIVLAALMMQFDKPMRFALDLLRTKRPKTKISPKLLDLLAGIDVKLQTSRSIAKKMFPKYNWWPFPEPGTQQRHSEPNKPSKQAPSIHKAPAASDPSGSETATAEAKRADPQSLWAKANFKVKPRAEAFEEKAPQTDSK